MPLAVCATPIGNLEDVTLRVLRELHEADLVLCEDTRRTRILLERHGIEARLLSYHEHNEAERTAEVLPRLQAGERVALASDANAGTFGGWGQMPLVIGLGATALGMTVDEALTAATVGGAASLGLSLERGRLAPGLTADFVAWDAEHEGAFALQLGAVRAQRVWVAGREVQLES